MFDIHVCARLQATLRAHASESTVSRWQLALAGATMRFYWESSGELLMFSVRMLHAAFALHRGTHTTRSTCFEIMVVFIAYLIHCSVDGIEVD